MRSLILSTFGLIVTFKLFADQTPTPATNAKSVSPRPTATASPVATPAIAKRDLIGLWEAKRRFGPDIRGALLIRTGNPGLSAEIAGYSAPVKTDKNAVSFELFDGKTAFRGCFTENRAKIVGHWIQPS